MLSDAQARIIYNITREVIDLFNRRGSISDWPSWVQAAMLLDHTVIPCDYFVPEELFDIMKGKEAVRYRVKEIS